MKKLNARGAAHIIALVGVIVLSGIIGSYLLFKSHADSCNQSVTNPQSAPVSNQNCGSTTPPSTTPVKQGLSCTLSGVPAVLKPGQILSPSVTLSNTGNQDEYSGRIVSSVFNPLDLNNAFYGPYNANRGSQDVFPFKELDSVTIKAGTSQTFKLGAYQVNNRLSGSGSVSTHLSYSNKDGGVDCKTSFKVAVAPIKSLTMQSTDWWHDSGVRIVTDGNYGKVAQLNPNSGRGYVLSDNLYNQAKVAKFYDFLYANSGRKVKVCETMRTANYSMKVPIFAYATVYGHSPSAAVDIANQVVTNKYKKYCQIYTTKLFKDYREDSVFNIGGNMSSVSKDYKISNVYLKEVTFTLQ